MARFLRERARRRTSSDGQIDGHRERDVLTRHVSQKNLDRPVDENHQNDLNAGRDRAETPVVTQPGEAPLVIRHIAATPTAVNPVLQQAYGANDPERVQNTRDRRGNAYRAARTATTEITTKVMSQADIQAISQLVQRTHEVVATTDSLRLHV